MARQRARSVEFVIHDGQALQYVPALVREIGRHLHEPAAAVGQGMAEDDLERFREIARHRITDLDRWAERGGAADQYGSEIALVLDREPFDVARPHASQA